MSSTHLITHLKGIAQVREQPHGPLKGGEMSILPTLENAWISTKQGKIEDFGLMDQCPDPSLYDRHTLGHGRWVFPGFVDSHTHLVFAAGRESEFVDRIKGLSYEEIAARGGGILNSAQKMALASEEELYDRAWERLQEVIATGTTAIEIKSGYGLTTETELKMLRVIKALKSKAPIPIKATFLGAHAFPTEYKNNHQGYIDLIVKEMLPRIAEEELADYCDVFCDKGFFNEEETAQVLRAAQTYGLGIRLHANELGLTGGVQVGVAHKALSVDHLEYTSPIEWALLKASDTMPTLLPGTAFFLGIPYPDARSMIQEGLPVALASDFNPGSCPSGNMPFVLSLACIRMKMLPEEAINAATVNTAYTLGLLEDHGSITRGKIANFWMSIPIDGPKSLPYYFGSKLVDKVWINGSLYQP